MLTRSLARRDFASAAELLSLHGHSAINRRAPRAFTADAPVPLASACPGGETSVVTPTGLGKFYRIRRSLADVSEREAAIAGEYAAVLRGARQRLREMEAHAALCHAADARPEDLLFMDIETCGLSGTMIFLVGLMYYAGEQLMFEQYLARDYSEEAAILQAFADRYASAGVLVTFNGKAFDMNLIRERSAFHAQELAYADRRHLDLLHESRRRWRGQVPNCRLQTLEAHFCGRRRIGDIPSWAIPDAYHRFVSTGDAAEIRDILRHNLLDLLTMAQLLCLVLTNCDPAA